MLRVQASNERSIYHSSVCIIIIIIIIREEERRKKTTTMRCDDDGVISGDGSGPIGWDSVQPILQYWLYTYYGDKRTLETFYDSTERWITVLEKVSIKRIENGLSDWMNAETTGNVRALTGHIFLWRNYDAWSKINDVLKRTAIAAIYKAKAKKVADVMNAKFLELDGTYKGGRI